MAFMPLRPDCGNDPQWEDWNCYRSILAIGWPDCEQLLIPTLKQIFPVKDPTNGEVQEEFDLGSLADALWQSTVWYFWWD